MHMYGMSEYLEKQGWKVFMFTPEPVEMKTTIPALQKYLKAGGNCPFVVKPTYKTDPLLQSVYVDMMVKRLEEHCGKLNKYGEIVIESCESIRSSWAELLAEKIGARHIFLATEENFRLSASCYEDNLDFYYFKFKRNELIGYPQNIRNLFNGYKDVNDLVSEETLTYLAEPEPIKDVPKFPVDKVKKLDWNICHIGRTMKAFVKYVITGVGEFARRHPDKKINFMFVGEIIPERQKLLDETFDGVDNVAKWLQRLTNTRKSLTIPLSLRNV